MRTLQLAKEADGGFSNRGMAQAVENGWPAFAFLWSAKGGGMIVFEGTYMLERKGDPGAGPIHACAWQVKIVDLSYAEPSSPHIRPYAVLAFRNEGGFFKTSCAESLGKRICRDFDLKVGDLLWVEAFPDLPGELFVAVFKPRYYDEELHYSVTWRPIQENERVAVAAWC